MTRTGVHPRVKPEGMLRSKTLLGVPGGLRKFRIGPRRLEPLPQFLRGDEAGADKFAPAPDQRAHPQHLPAGGEGEAEKLRYRQRADVETDAIVGYFDDQTLDPGRVGCRDQKSRLVQIDPNLLARAAIFAGSRQGCSLQAKIRNQL